MNVETVKGAIGRISELIDENRSYLIELDQRMGDGDLGVSMSDGFKGLKTYLSTTSERDLGKLMMQLGAVFNESAPSSLGTILSIGFVGMAKALRGMETASFDDFVQAFEGGIQRIMDKAGSKPGEKTILDSLYPALLELKANALKPGVAIKNAAAAATIGSDQTKKMLAVHGRAAYYGERSLGVLDGGSVVGKLIIQGITLYLKL